MKTKTLGITIILRFSFFGYISAQSNLYMYNSYGIKEKVGTIENDSPCNW
jgi:hypothetical protein